MRGEDSIRKRQTDDRRLEDIVGRRRGRGARRADAVAPSERATERLRHELDREVADLRLQLEEASLRSDVYLHAGYPDEAAEVVDEQRRLLSRFEDRLRQSVSEAAVEAEAERVFAGVPGVEALSDTPAVDDGDRPRLAPTIASAAAAALVAMLVVTAPGSDGHELSSTESARPDGNDPQVAALGDEMDRADQRGRTWTLPAPSSPQPVGSTDAAALGAPVPSPTERLAKLIEGLTAAAEDAIRDALRALLDDGADPATVARTIEELTPAETTPQPPLRSDDEARDEDGSEAGSEGRSSDGGGSSDDGADGDGSDGAGADDPDDSEGDGSLSDVPQPVQGNDDSPYEG